MKNCPVCWDEVCPGGAHLNALYDAGITTREQWLALKPQSVGKEVHNEGMDGL